VGNCTSTMVPTVFRFVSIFGFAHSSVQVEDAFLKYKRDFQRKYADDSDEHKVRYQRFKKAYSQVHQLDDAPVMGGKFEFGEYSDRTEDELFQRRLGFSHDNISILNRSLRSSSGSRSLASSVDWVVAGGVTPVKDQASCGSCWAFTVTGALEGAVFAATGQLVSMSEEQFLDCDRYDHGCQGGNMARAMLWAQGSTLCTETQYPYAGGSPTPCASSGCNGLPQGCVTGMGVAGSGDQGLAAAVAGRPVSIAVAGDVLAGYRSGVVYMTTPCSLPMVNHGVVVVGYTPDYWRVKNSWGAGWGEGGYARILRESSPNGQMPPQGSLGPFCMYFMATYVQVSSSCQVHPSGVSDKDHMWTRFFTSMYFWPVVVAITCSSCLLVAAFVYFLRSRGQKARQLRNEEQGSGVSMLGL